MEFQLSLFDKLGDGYQKRMVQAALEEAGNGSETIEQMLEAYLLGDAEALATVMEKSQRKESKEFAEKFRELLIVARNKGMTKRILELLKEHPKRSHFFAVGAAHTFGEDGIVDLLREQGVKVEQLNGAGDVVAEPAPKKPPRRRPSAARRADRAIGGGHKPPQLLRPPHRRVVIRGCPASARGDSPSCSGLNRYGRIDHVYDRAMVEAALFRSGGVNLKGYQYVQRCVSMPTRGLGKKVGHVYIHVKGDGNDSSATTAGAKTARCSPTQTPWSARSSRS